jgi:hypothetical protein
LNIALINGSPKKHNSASETISLALRDRLGAAECTALHAANQDGADLLAAVAGCHADRKSVV